MKSTTVMPIPVNAPVNPGEQVFIHSLYDATDVPGHWIYVGPADNQHNSTEMCVVKQREPYIFEQSEGIVDVNRLSAISWPKRLAFQLPQHTKSKQPKATSSQPPKVIKATTKPPKSPTKSPTKSTTSPTSPKSSPNSLATKRGSK